MDEKTAPVRCRFLYIFFRTCHPRLRPCHPGAGGDRIHISYFTPIRLKSRTAPCDDRSALSQIRTYDFASLPPKGGHAHINTKVLSGQRSPFDDSFIRVTFGSQDKLQRLAYLTPIRDRSRTAPLSALEAIAA